MATSYKCTGCRIFKDMEVNVAGHNCDFPNFMDCLAQAHYQKIHEASVRAPGEPAAKACPACRVVEGERVTIKGGHDCPHPMALKALRAYYRQERYEPEGTTREAVGRLVDEECAPLATGRREGRVANYASDGTLVPAAKGEANILPATQPTIKALEDKVRELDENLDEATDYMDELEADCRMLREEVAVLKARIAEQEATIRSLRHLSDDDHATTTTTTSDDDLNTAMAQLTTKDA